MHNSLLALWLAATTLASDLTFVATAITSQILSMPDEQIRQGLVTCSTGNHALAFVYACSRSTAASEAHSTIYLPTTASPAKVAVALFLVGVGCSLTTSASV
jgi:threonine dehydratase